MKYETHAQILSPTHMRTERTKEDKDIDKEGKKGRVYIKNSAVMKIKSRRPAYSSGLPSPGVVTPISNGRIAYLI